MGLNTAVLILNDALGSAQSDPKGFAENLLEAVREHGQGRIFPHGHGRECHDFAIGNNVNGGSVIYQSHADYTGVLAIGGNYATKLGTVYGYSHHTKERQIVILENLAKELGFRLVKE